MSTLDLAGYHAALRRLTPFAPTGVVTRAIGLTVEVRGLHASIGECCQILMPDDSAHVLAEVVGFRDEVLLLMPLGELHGVQPGSRVARCAEPLLIPAGEGVLGRVVNALGQPIDGRGPLADLVRWVDLERGEGGIDG